MYPTDKPDARGSAGRLTEFFKSIFDNSMGYLCIARRGAWDGEFFKYPQELGSAVAYALKWSDTTDVYFCPFLFNDPYFRTTSGKGPRVKENVVDNVTCSWADADGCSPNELNPAPTHVWQSSPSHWQALWKFEHPVPKDIAEDISCRIAYAHEDQDCDTSGWDLTQLLRVPETRNYKDAYRDSDGNPAPVGQASWSQGLYRVSDFAELPEVVRHVPPVGPPLIGEILNPLRISQKLRDLAESEIPQGQGEKRLYAIVAQADDDGLRDGEILTYVAEWVRLYRPRFIGREEQQVRICLAKKRERDKSTTQNGHCDFDSEVYDRAKLASLPTVESLIENTFGRHSIILVSGRRGTFKSYLVIDWACCLATGIDWIDRKAKPGKVLYVVGEGAYGLHSRIRAWELKNGIHVSSDRLVVLPRALKLFKNKQEVSEFCDFVTREGFTLVIFDTLRRMSNGAIENSNNEMGEIIDAIESVKRATKDGSVIVVAHTDATDTKTRGGTSIEDDIDVVYYTKLDDGIVTLKHGKNKYGPEQDPINLRTETVQTDVMIDDKMITDVVLRPVPFALLGKMSAQIDKECDLYKMLCDIVEKTPNSNHGFVGTKQLSDAVMAAGMKIQGAVKLTAIGQLVKDGWLVKTKLNTSDLYNVSEKYKEERPWGE